MASNLFICQTGSQEMTLLFLHWSWCCCRITLIEKTVVVSLSLNKFLHLGGHHGLRVPNFSRARSFLLLVH